MSWVRIEPEAPYHPKVVQVGVAAFGVFCAGLCYANKFLTDGFIPLGALSAVFPGERWSCLLKLAVKLVEVGLWEKREAGWQIHDYHHYQPTKAEVLEERRRAAERYSAGGRARASIADRVQGRFMRTSDEPATTPALPPALTSPVPVPVPVPEKKEPRVAENGSSPPPTFQIPGSIEAALSKCPTLGPALQNPRFWQAQVRSKPGVNFAAELLQAESWVVANPQRAPKKSVPAFMNRWFGRAYEGVKA